MLHVNQGLLQLHFHSDWNDLTIASGHATLAKPECHIQLPKNWSIQSVHPDVLALSISLIIYPFCGVNIRLPFGVSKPFHDTFKEVTNKNILPIDHHLKPRTAPPLSVPALAYSGGTDSTAALALLPDSTHLFFLDRSYRTIKLPNITKKQLITLVNSFGSLEEKCIW